MANYIRKDSVTGLYYWLFPLLDYLQQIDKRDNKLAVYPEQIHIL